MAGLAGVAPARRDKRVARHWNPTIKCEQCHSLNNFVSQGVSQVDSISQADILRHYLVWTIAVPLFRFMQGNFA
ncbi:hypothetical protein [Bacillus sp. FJAT-27445]|uniref:hypothetical protein n=1 Tax=Bacillus sp. FJAT-27445 TaxID=1679166 RepID=UPI0007435C4E|nr:hypothetical protein [Bacillus sp. FJAT-27445]